MKTTLLAALTALIALATPTPGSAAETGSLSCSGGIVSLGATTGEVVNKCGQPTSSTQREDKRVEGGPRTSRDRTITAVTVDDWIYNFGPNQFQYRLLFENGRVARIESLDYGY